MLKRILAKIKQKGEALFLEVFHLTPFVLKQKDIIILDDLYPHPVSSFRNIEFKAYKKQFNKVEIHSSGDALSAVHEQSALKELIQKHDPSTIQFNHHRKLKSKLAYSIFLSNIDGFLKVIERNKIPFIFTLYPGGFFFLDTPETNFKLKRVFNSKYFKKVIVTQKISYEYLIENQLCNKNQIEFIYGVVSPPISDPSIRRSQINKTGINICFVANKQMQHGYDKGYDLFIESILILQKTIHNIHVHIVGPYNTDDYDVSLVKNITFHGLLNQKELHAFFLSQDMIISPNRAFVLKDGAFDGFPTAACTEAAANGVAMFVTDPLNQNIHFKNNTDIVIINDIASDIAKTTSYYIKNKEELKKISHNGFKKVQDVYSYKNQIEKRIEILTKLLNEK